MILTTIEQFKAVVPTAAGVEDFADLKPYCNSAELWIKNRVLGKTLYDFVDGLGESPAGTDIDLHSLCVNIIGNHAYWDAIPFLDLVHTNSGFGVINNSNKAPASKERVERLRQQCIVRRDNEVENLITFLEETVAYHDNWKGSPAYSIISECLIQTSSELEVFGQWEGTRKDFLKLRPKLIQETIVKLEPLFSKDYINELIEKQRDNDISGDDLRVMFLLKQSLGSLVSGNMEAAERIAADALRYIDANLLNFTTYVASSEYAARIAEGYINEEDSQIFSSLF